MWTLPKWHNAIWENIFLGNNQLPKLDSSLRRRSFISLQHTYHPIRLANLVFLKKTEHSQTKTFLNISSISIINFDRAVPSLLGREIWHYCIVHTQRRHARVMDRNIGYYCGSIPTFFKLLFIFLLCLFIYCLIYISTQHTTFIALPVLKLRKISDLWASSTSSGLYGIRKYYFIKKM